MFSVLAFVLSRFSRLTPFGSSYWRPAALPFPLTASLVLLPSLTLCSEVVSDG
jgi:hypothetical protein